MKKPMLLSNDEFNLKDLDYSNMYSSIKRDGVRFEISNQGIKGRSLKELKNKLQLEKYFKDFINSLPYNIIIEGEFYKHGLKINEITPYCNSKDKEILEGFKIYVFGVFDLIMNFEDRYNWLKTHLGSYNNVELVKQFKVNSSEEVKHFYDNCIADGFEGSVLMDGSKKYKENRIRINEHIGFKLKPSREDDLEIIGVNERFENTNESKINELGHKYKRNTVDAKEATGIAGTFTCKLPNDETTKVTITGDETFRRDIWQHKEDYIGQYAVVKSMDYGTKDKLRHPRLISIKNQVEK